jgi:hypothetical protein
MLKGRIIKKDKGRIIRKDKGRIIRKDKGRIIKKDKGRIIRKPWFKCAKRRIEVEQIFAQRANTRGTTYGCSPTGCSPLKN